MSLEGEIQHYIAKEGWDIDYRYGSVGNIWGNRYTVNLGYQDGCLGQLGYSNPSEGEIFVNQPCTSYADTHLVESNVAMMAHTLAHEQAHADTAALALSVPLAVMGIGAMGTLADKVNPLPFLVSMPIAAGSYPLALEAFAFVGSTFRGVPFLSEMYMQMPWIF